jgi:3-oxoacyl-[acyl-carrier protein] reductase
LPGSVLKEDAGTWAAIRNGEQEKMDMWDFRNRTLLLTGATGGIGRATAAVFARAGANLILIDVKLGALQEFAKSLSTSGGASTLCVDADVSQFEQCVAATKRGVELFGGIDIVVAGAGIYPEELFATMTSAQWQRTLDVNLTGVYNTIRAALSYMRDGSSVISLSSLAGHKGGSLGHAHYGATKGAILSLTRGLARELAPKIRVNAVSPGIIETPMTRDMLEKFGADRMKETPLGRLGKAEEVASAIAFLASDQASFITGEVLHVNGGIYMD